MTSSANTGGDLPEMSAGGESLAQENGNVLRKGPWTKEEDEILVNFVKEKGIVKWSSIGKQTGLARSGKSCRLRWLNHLRPNLKKGSFTKEEENLIVRLHSEYGNKWTRIASKLPGRTDNEIKNFWNTRVKKCQKRQLPLYPETVEEDHSRVVDANYDYNPRFCIDNLDKKFTSTTDFDQNFQSSANAPSEACVSSLHQLSSISPHSWSLQQLTSPMYLPPQSFQSPSFESSSKHPLSQPLSTGHHFPSENRFIPTQQSTHFFLQHHPSSQSLQQSKTLNLSMQSSLSSSAMPPPTWLSSLPEDDGSLLTQQSSVSHSTHPLIKPSMCASTLHQYPLMLSLNNKQSSRFKSPGGILPRPLSAPLIYSTPTLKKPFSSTLEMNSSNYLSSVTPLNMNSTMRTSTSPTYQLNFPTVGLSDSSLQDKPLSVDLTWPSISRSMNEPISPISSFISKMEPPSIQSISAAAVKYPSDTSLSQLNAQSMASFNLTGTQLQEEELVTGGGQSSRKDDFFGQNLTRESFLTECMKAEDSLVNILSKENVPNEISPTEFLLDKYSIKDGILTHRFDTTDLSDSSLNTENASYKSRRRKEFMNISRENNGLHTRVTEKVDILNEISKPTFLQDGSSRHDNTISEKSEGVLGEESLKRDVNKATLTDGPEKCDLLVEDTREKYIMDTGSKKGFSSEQYEFTKCLKMEDSLSVQCFNVRGEFTAEARKDLLEEASMKEHDASMSKDIHILKVNSGKEFLLTSDEQYHVANKANQVSNQRHTSLLLESGGRDINSCSMKHSAEHIEAEDHIDTEISSLLDYFPMTAEIPEWYNTSQEISNSKTAL